MVLHQLLMVFPVPTREEITQMNAFAAESGPGNAPLVFLGRIRGGKKRKKKKRCEGKYASGVKGINKNASIVQHTIG